MQGSKATIFDTLELKKVHTYYALLTGLMVWHNCFKLTCLKEALKEQANAFVSLSEKCQSIFTAQRAIATIIPKEKGSKNHHSEYYSLCVSVITLL